MIPTLLSGNTYSRKAYTWLLTVWSLHFKHKWSITKLQGHSKHFQVSRSRGTSGQAVPQLALNERAWLRAGEPYAGGRTSRPVHTGPWWCLQSHRAAECNKPTRCKGGSTWWCGWEGGETAARFPALCWVSSSPVRTGASGGTDTGQEQKGLHGPEEEKRPWTAAPHGDCVGTGALVSAAVCAKVKLLSPRCHIKAAQEWKNMIKKTWVLRPSTGPCNYLHQKSEANLQTSIIHAKSARCAGMNFSEKTHTLYVKPEAVGGTPKKVRITTQ